MPDDEPGARLLVTVLFSRTQPLIRYALDDRVELGSGACPCGRPFKIAIAVEGRQEDVLDLQGEAGRPVLVHPNVFHDVLDTLPVTGWQVIEEPEGLRVLLASRVDGPDAEGVRERVVAALAKVGVSGIRVIVERLAEIPRTALGKAPLVRRARPGDRGTGPFSA